MPRRYLSIWFPFLATDRLEKKEPGLRQRPFVCCAPERGRKIVKAANRIASGEGIRPGMVLADVRAICPLLEDFEYDHASVIVLLNALAEWCLRFTPIAAVDPPDGLILDISGCPHLWGGEQPYLETITARLHKGGYDAHAGIADTIGAAWAVARYGRGSAIVEPGCQTEAMLSLPPLALRLEASVLQRMQQLGFGSIGQFITIPGPTLRRRFGQGLLQRIGQAFGTMPESLKPVQPVQPYQERLPCLEPIRTATGIETALSKLLDTLCARMTKEGKGLRSGIFRGYRIDGWTEQIAIGTSRASHNPAHLFGLFALKISCIEPALGIELFVLEAPLVEDVSLTQEAFWDTGGNHTVIAELLDNIAGKVGMAAIKRYLPMEHHWPERSTKPGASLDRQPEAGWNTQKPRPLHLLPRPEPVEVMVPLPDYPPVLFRHGRKTYQLKKADGPERIEREWWMDGGEPRDYYRVEDDNGARYWLFRLGHYGDGEPGWFLHGFFA